MLRRRIPKHTVLPIYGWHLGAYPCTCGMNPQISLEENTLTVRCINVECEESLPLHRSVEDCENNNEAAREAELLVDEWNNQVYPERTWPDDKSNECRPFGGKDDRVYARVFTVDPKRGVDIEVTYLGRKRAYCIVAYPDPDGGLKKCEAYLHYQYFDMGTVDEFLAWNEAVSVAWQLTSFVDSCVLSGNLEDLNEDSLNAVLKAHLGSKLTALVAIHNDELTPFERSFLETQGELSSLPK